MLLIIRIETQWLNQEVSETLMAMATCFNYFDKNYLRVYLSHNLYIKNSDLYLTTDIFASRFVYNKYEYTSIFYVLCNWS